LWIGEKRREGGGGEGGGRGCGERRERAERVGRGENERDAERTEGMAGE